MDAYTQWLMDYTTAIQTAQETLAAGSDGDDLSRAPDSQIRSDIASLQAIIARKPQSQ